MASAKSPLELLSSIPRTTLSMPGGLTLGFGAGPGLASGFYWNRIGSLFSCYRPSIARLHIFEYADPHSPLALRLTKQVWEPNLLHCEYEAGDLLISEDKYATQSGLACRLTITLQSARPARDLLLFYHGSTEQWPFFDFDQRKPMPSMRCQIDPDICAVILEQPHPHAGCEEFETVQRIQAGPRFESFGFMRNEGELANLWSEHGALASLSLRLGQVGGRLNASRHAKTEQKQPAYYFSIRQKVEAAAPSVVYVSCGFNLANAKEAPNARPLEAPDPKRYSEKIAAGEHKAWETYLNMEVPQLECNDPELRRYWYYVWYILRANRCPAGEHIHHPYTAPSKYMYWGPWIWDGYFHVLGEMWLKDGEVAADSIRAVLDMRYSNGFIPVCSGTDRRMCFSEDVSGYRAPEGGGFANYLHFNAFNSTELEHPFEAALESVEHGETKRVVHCEKTQTPLITIAAADYSEIHEKSSLVEEVLGDLRDYDDWLWRRRRDKSNRFVLWHGDESGWDNATRHYPVPALPFDVQVHCALHREALLRLERLHCEPDAQRIAESEHRLKATLESLSTYWDRNARWHYDHGLNTDGSSSPRKQIAASGLFALLLDCEPKVLDACLSAIRDSKVFGTDFPIPTLAACDPDYSPHGWGWNGPAWLQVNYFVITGLLKNRRAKEALELWEQTRRFLIHDGMPNSFELYDPETGEGIGCPDYSWQAMFLHLIIRHFAGLHREAIRPLSVAWELELKLSNLAGRVESISFQRVDSSLHIWIAYTSPQTPLLDLSLLEATYTLKANGLEMQGNGDGTFTLEAAVPQKRWEIIALCI